MTVAEIKTNLVVSATFDGKPVKFDDLTPKQYTAIIEQCLEARKGKVSAKREQVRKLEAALKAARGA